MTKAQSQKFQSTIIVTIDGPAASGKTSVSRLLAQSRGWSWVSTGAFYRGLAYVAQALGISLDEEKALVKLGQSDRWRVQLHPQRTQVFLGDRDVTDQIYQEEVGEWASKISQFPLVREGLLQAQRNCAKGVVGLVAEGRDCGTVVFPQAQIKIYLDAEASDRALRRATEEKMDLADVEASQVRRDHQDQTRTVAPLVIPSQAYYLNTSGLNLKEVLSRVEDWVEQQIKCH